MATAAPTPLPYKPRLPTAVDHRQALIDLVLSALTLDHPPESEYFEAITAGMLDLTLSADQATLSQVADALRRVQASWQPHSDDPDWARALGRLDGAVAFVSGAAARLPSAQAGSSIGTGTQAHIILAELSKRRSCASSDLLDMAGGRQDALSRTTAKLQGLGAVTRQKIGRKAYWEITPRGRDLLAILGEAPAPQKASGAAAGKARSNRDAIGAGTVIDIATGKPLELDPTELAQRQRSAGSPQQRARFMMLTLLALRPDALTERIGVWGSLADFAVREPFYLVPRPDASSEDMRDVAWRAMSWVRDEPLPRRSWGTVAPPVWDAYAVVPGADGAYGVVLIEAKSHPREFATGGGRPKSAATKEALRDVLLDTSDFLDARKPWRTWPEYPDPARRLAFLRFLHANGIPSWVFNAYFVAPGAESEPASSWEASLEPRDHWEACLATVRKSLTIKPTHALSPYVEHEFFMAPLARESEWSTPYQQRWANHAAWAAAAVTHGALAASLLAPGR